MSEFSMYVCPQCRKTFKVKGNNKKIKCPQCSEGLLDMNISFEAWSVIDKANKSNIIKNMVDKRIHQIGSTNNKMGTDNATPSQVKAESQKENVLTSESKTKDDYLKRLEEEIRKNKGNALSFSKLNELITEFSPSYSITMSEISNDMKVIIRKIGREIINNDNNSDPIPKREIKEEQFYAYLCPSCKKVYKIPESKKNEKCSSCNVSLRNLVILYDQWITIDNDRKAELIQSNLKKYNDEKKSSFFDEPNKNQQSYNTQANKNTNTSNFGRMDDYEKIMYGNSHSEPTSTNPIVKIRDWFNGLSNAKKGLVVIIIVSILVIGLSSISIVSDRNQIKAKIVSEMTGLWALKNPRVINADWGNNTFDALVDSVQGGSGLILYNRLSDSYSGNMKLMNVIDNSTGDTYCLGNRIEKNGTTNEGKLVFKNKTEVLFDKVAYDAEEAKKAAERQKKEQSEQRRRELTGQSSGSSSSGSSSGSGSSYSSKGYAETLSDDDKDLYYFIAQKEVKARLKSPSSAKFPYIGNDGVSVKKEGDIVTVVAWVEADNSFGAAIRNVFIVELKINGSKYSCQSCIILE